ncbi:leucine Rich Repeat [Seminavis robusta]|uniref:Leucine Rich Repeat n=1 Tax=Seminavis robusta TaxID=568900 RepID=A0A9N8H255_9STRA|nr:leucine Rich Repeat [Seminavis robusta]|eukprot:Sro13_g009800.1 leucine Rich Repeat (290) ;mRNA; r:33374-34243
MKVVTMTMIMVIAATTVAALAWFYTDGTCSSGDEDTKSYTLQRDSPSSAISDKDVDTDLALRRRDPTTVHVPTALPTQAPAIASAATTTATTTQRSRRRRRRINENTTNQLPPSSSAPSASPTAISVTTTTTVELFGETYHIANTTVIDRAEKGLTGTLPSEIGLLTALTKIRLWGNHISGNIPTEIIALTALEDLYLGGNDLVGGIRTELGLMTNLDWLSLWGNIFFGEIPSELGLLTQLTMLDIYNNQLSGHVPGNLCDNTALAIIRVDCHPEQFAVQCVCQECSCH